MLHSRGRAPSSISEDATGFRQESLGFQAENLLQGLGKRNKDGELSKH